MTDTNELEQEPRSGLSDLTSGLGGCVTFDSFMDEMQRLEDERAPICAQDRRDAKRYRWLRDSKSSGAMLRLMYEDGQSTPEFLDKEIDAAMIKTPNVEVRGG